MATYHHARKALTIALLGTLALPATATDYPDGVVVGSRSAVLLEPGDTISIAAGTEPRQAVHVEGRGSFDAQGIAITNASVGRPDRRAYGIAAIDGADVVLDGSSLTMTGDWATGLQVQDNAHATVVATDITLHGDVGIGLSTLHGASIDLTDSRVVAHGRGATALASVGGVATIRGGELRSERGHAILGRFTGARADSVVTLERTSVVGDIESGDRRLTIGATDTRIVGDIVRGGEGRLDVTLTRSPWQGRAQAVSSLTIASGDWQVTGDVESRLEHLRLNHAGKVLLDDPSPGFRTLRVGSLDAADGNAGIRLGTRLDAGGPLRLQSTDRLLVEGDVTGTTPLEIVHRGGTGASTEHRRRGIRSEEGISVVQVGGQAAADSFRLRQGYVVVGPYRYGLYAYAPGQTAAAQRLVAGEGDYWDYRLQTVRVDDDGASAPGEWTRGVPAVDGDMRDALAPQVPAYLVLSHALFGYGRDVVDTLHTQGIPADDERPRLRASTFAGNATYRSSLPFARYGVDYARKGSGLVVSGDLLTGWVGDARGRAGLAASVGSSQVMPRAVDGVGRVRTRSRGLTAMVSLDGESGWRIDGTYGVTHHRIDVDTPGRGEVLGRLRANANEASLATSFRWDASDRFALVPSASVVWQKLRFGEAIDRDDIAVRVGTPERTTLRGGARASWTFAPRFSSDVAWSPYVDVRYVLTRGAGEGVDLAGVAFATGRAGRGVELAVGAEFALRHDVTLRVASTSRQRLGRGGESGLIANAGIDWRF